MRNLVFRLFFIVIFGALLFSYIFPWNSYNIEVPFSGKDYKLGLDLQGGIELDYKVDLEEVKLEEGYNKTKETEIIEGLKSIIDKRIQSLNINDSVLTSASYAGEQHIIVQIPLKGNDSLENNENIQKAKDAIGKVVKIEFKEKRTEISDADIAERKVLAESALKEINTSLYNFTLTADKFKLAYENVEIGETENVSEIFEIETPVSKEIIDTPNGYLILSDLIDNRYSYIFISKTPSNWQAAKDSKGRILNDTYFVNSSVQFNEAFQPMIELVFNSEGTEIFGELTSRLTGQQIAIFVGGELLTAPNVNEPILTGKAVITGSYTAEEARKLSTDINTGVVPAPIYLTSEKTIDSKLGASSLEKLIIAGVSGFIIIFIFLIFVYRVGGLMASISLFLYIILVLTIIKTLGIVLTLASIAGLILSIGMAIDANILIFERIKDELKKGKDLEESTTIGFKKSWTAIWDSNFTGLIVALILFIFGVNIIKGFGLMLAIGIVVSLFSAMWISRILLILISKVVKDKKNFIGL
ncbi:protein translocase subunit SecD [Candidatus Gracilibacteria bacterium 28_42_T64]|nr:protein translocase subunit SecD [Candidatus Gracilibacteria bacterium 28_42_T64]